MLFPVGPAAAAAAKSLQSWLTLCDPRDGSPPGSPVPGILQARTLEWVAISFSTSRSYCHFKEFPHLRMGIVANISFLWGLDEVRTMQIFCTLKQHVSDKSYPSSQTVLPVTLKKQHVMGPQGGLAWKCNSALICVQSVYWHCLEIVINMKVGVIWFWFS